MRRLEIWIPIVVVALDQGTKALVRAGLAVSETLVVVPGFMNLTHVRNTGAAFGMFNAADFPYKTLMLATIAFAGLVLLGFYAAQLPREQFLARLGLALILGGAAGNLIDRLVEGSVVDFVDVYFGTWHFWAFNVADSAITVGVSVMLLDLLGMGTHVSKTV
jgi:signal peptidase II